MRTLSRLTPFLAVLSMILIPTYVFAHTSSQGKMMKIPTRILSPSPGAVIHGNVLHVRASFQHWMLSCAWAGKASQPMTGHYHIRIDGALINMFCRDQATVSLQNLRPGKHMLEVVPAENNHMELMASAKMIKFSYRPTNRLPIVTSADLGKPSISIVSPHNGQTVHGTFVLRVNVRNFRLSCALYGKQNLKGYGHWHANVDTTMGPMMGMGTMLGMSCANRFKVSTVGLRPGTHKFIAQLEDNQHAPIMPETQAFVTLNVR